MLFYAQKRRVRSTDRITQNPRTRNDAVSAWRVRFIPQAPKYMERVYIIVSEEPISTDAHLPAKLSGPQDENKVSAIAVAALPDTGRMIISGIISVGMPKGLAMQLSKVHKYSSAPLAASILVAHIKRIRLGSIFTDVTNPSLVPLSIAEKQSLEENKTANAAQVIIIAIE